MEGDSDLLLTYSSIAFQSTPSAWRETGRYTWVASAEMLISIHSLRVEGDPFARFVILVCVISIHSLRVEGDKCNSIRFVGGSISIHSLRVEGDPEGVMSCQ